MGIQLKIQNFRCLRNVDWSPDGVCVLVGPNGSGKSTLFDALNFLRLAYEMNLSQAIAASGGPYFRSLDAPPQESVGFSLTQGIHIWEVSLSFGGGPSNPSIRERLTQGYETILLNLPEEQGFSFRGQKFQVIDTVGLRAAAFVSGAETGLPIISTVKGFLVYGSYALQQLRQNGSPLTGDMQLSLNGSNAFGVLRNWRDKRDYRPSYDFVAQEICSAFPGISDELDFEFAGQITSLRLVDSRRAQSIPVTFAPNGWLAGLLHLMAVAGAKPGTVVLIDEFENSLHPYAIRHLVRAMREWAAKRQLTIVLAGHSPALLDEFRDDPSRVFVMEPWQPGQPSMPRRLTDYRDPEWLKHFSLGELYRHEDFGGPRESSANSAPAMTRS